MLNLVSGTNSGLGKYLSLKLPSLAFSRENSKDYSLWSQNVSAEIHSKLTLILNLQIDPKMASV